MKKLTKAILGLSLALAAGCVSVPKVDNAPVAVLDLSASGTRSRGSTTVSSAAWSRRRPTIRRMRTARSRS